jgi:hypothetical protein
MITSHAHNRISSRTDENGELDLPQDEVTSSVKDIKTHIGK